MINESPFPARVANGAGMVARKESDMTQKELFAAVRTLGLRISKSDGEYRIAWPANESAAYYTDDKADALATAQRMARESAPVADMVTIEGQDFETESLYEIGTVAGVTYYECPVNGDEAPLGTVATVNGSPVWQYSDFWELPTIEETVACEVVDEPSAMERGKALAQATVDYIGAIPATFESEQEREFWQGYLVAESDRVAAGNRDESEYWQAMERFARACNAYAIGKAKAAAKPNRTRFNGVAGLLAGLAKGE